jgi:soluble lytic murein transglycosylase-like protein
MQWRLMLCGLLTGGLALGAQDLPVRAEAVQGAAPPAAAPTAGSAKAATLVGTGGGETVQQALCRLIDASARAQALPVEFFTRLIWQESSFRTGVVSSAGAQGVAQFMPGTAAERGLLDPFDPEQAIPASARLLRAHVDQFGNIGLAAAAYNGGPGRVANWLFDKGGLPEETRSYVVRITGRSAEDWAEERRARVPSAAEPEVDGSEGAGDERKQAEGTREGAGRPAAVNPSATSCLQVVALLRRPGRDDPLGGVATAFSLAPWGVQLAGNFSKTLALASYARESGKYARLLGDVRPMVIGTRLRSRGTRTFYRVRVPATTRTAAEGLCTRIRSAGGACIVLPS